MPFLTGNTGGLTECRQFLLPADFYVRIAIRGAVNELTDARQWEKFGDLEPDECAQIVKESLATWGPCSGASGFGSGPISDDFNREDEYPLANWQHWLAGIELSGGIARGISSGYNISWFNATNYGPDLEVHSRMVGADGSGSGMVVYARVNPFSGPTINGYLAAAIQASGDDYIVLQRIDSNVPTNLHSVIGQPVWPGHRIGMRIVGDQISLYYDDGTGWEERQTVTDATYSAAGRVGLTLIDPSSAVDDFTVTEL